MKPALPGSLLWLIGCASSPNTPPPVAPASPAPPASPPIASAASEDNPQRESRGADTPDLPEPAPEPSDDAPSPAGDPGAVAAPIADPVRPPVASDLAEYTQDLPGDGPLIATITTSMGAIHCELFADKSPMTVANFIGLATGKKAWRDPRTAETATDKPLYDGLIFHRVIPTFGIQSGDPLGQGVGGPGYQFGDEVDNGLTMRPGALIMANAGASTNGSQFFITEGTPSYLNGRHTIFGQCKDLGLIKRIARVPTSSGERPVTPVTIRKVVISRAAPPRAPKARKPRRP